MKAWLAPLVTAVVGLVVVLAVTADERRLHEVTPGHRVEVEIGHGRLGTSTWSLLASQSGDAELCMGVQWYPDGQDPADIACAFGSGDPPDDGGEGTEPAMVTVSGQGRVLAFGASPDGATRVVLSLADAAGGPCRSKLMAPVSLAITHRMPDWYPREGTGWFAGEVPRQAGECGVPDARFTDADGHTVDAPEHF